ncbi:MAG TPA: hypothetical protein VNE62_02655 [Actinomycetota bacterium]|nr:hypothetical protein [Actinomycetota bacterium]
MNRRTPAMRYAPLFALVAVQVLIIALAPSKAPGTSPVGGFGPGAAAGVGEVGAEVPIDPATGQPITGGGAAGGAGASGGAAGPAGAKQALNAAGIPVTGDTSHCVGGLQFDPAIFAFAPKCVPKFVGKNPGRTYRGVTDKKIKVLIYNGNFGTGIEEVLTAQGFAASVPQQQEMADASEKLINSKFELYGRELEIKAVGGACSAAPPDNKCLRAEFEGLVQREQPFAVVWGTSVSSESYDHLSDLKVVNMGGWFFRDSFSTERRPYHWDIQMSGSQIARHAAEWYCNRMHGGIARYSGEQDDMRAKPRTMGVITSDDPENVEMIKEFKGHLSRCGASVAPGKEYYYAQNLQTVEQQRDELVQKMKTPPEATTVLCFCELVAPIFLYSEAEQQQWWPEHIIVGTGFMDADQSAQTYDHFLPPAAGSAAPNDEPAKDEQFENAFGLAQADEQGSLADSFSGRAYKAYKADATGPPYDSAEVDFQYFMMLASMAQFAGPNLTPETLEQGAFRLGVIDPGGKKDPKLSQRSFKPGDYTWVDNLREVYWSTEKTSAFNGEKGRYITLNGGRWFSLGEYPKGQIELPAKPR